MGREKVLEFEDASRRMHVFVSRYARNRRLVHTDLFGDVAKYHRFHGFLTVIEELGLPRDDALRHF